MFNEHYIHEVYFTNDNRIFLLDIANTFDNKWESAYAEIDLNEFNHWWYMDNQDDPPTKEDIADCAEDAFDTFCWKIVATGTKRQCPRMYRELKETVERL